MALSRRQLIHRGAAGAGLVVVGNLTSLFPTSVSALGGRRATGLVTAARGGSVHSWATGYGRLVPDPDKLLDLPEGFSYTIVSETGKPLTGAEGIIPDAFDGSALFEVEGKRYLVRNSEQGADSEEDPVEFPALAGPEFTYDPIALGGTTTTELDADNNVVAEYVSLAGTVRNCAGGVTPWSTWLTCEETEDFAEEGGLTKDHGFVFEVDPVNVANNENPTPLEGLGRFAHEAVAIDPSTGIVYLTEDAEAPNGLLYRATPTTPLGGHGSLRDGALLEALVAYDDVSFAADLSEYSEIGTTLRTEWAALPDALAAEVPTRMQLNKVTRSRKLEGMWWGNDAAYVVCSYARHDDGSVAEHDGQVWRLDPAANTMELVVQFGVNPDPASDNFDGPDNITVSPWGGLVLCADGEGVQHLFTVNSGGEPTMFARNARDLEAEESSEFTGATFTADGQTLFVNLQVPGITFAITGPWDGAAAPASSTPATSTP
jgi:secreted PhoX family phosphatase